MDPLLEGGGIVYRIVLTMVQNIPEGPIATAFRNLNSVVVPAFVTVPKDEKK